MYPEALKYVDGATLRLALTDMMQAIRFLGTLPEPTPQPHLANRPLNGLGQSAQGKAAPVWTCHAIVRAFAATTPLKLEWNVVDGKYGPTGRNHAWLEYAMPEKGFGLILDVLPIGSLSGPIVLDASPTATRLLYQRGYTQAELDTFAAEAAIAANLYRDVLEDAHATHDF